MSDKPPPRNARWRRWRGASVRSLMLAVLLVGGGIGWMVHRARVQREAVAAIRHAGGSAAYDWERDHGLTTSLVCARAPAPRSEPPGPAWLRRWLGPDFVDTVTYVKLAGERCDDESLRAACRLPWLEELALEGTSVTDAGADDLRKLANLRSIDLRSNRFTPGPLRHIEGMSELRELTLAMSQSPVPLRDDHLAFLRRLIKLERLTLWGKGLSDPCLVYIEGSTRLEELELYGMAMTNQGLDHLRGLSNLRVLRLVGTRITSLEPLRPLTRITNLSIADAPVGDAALEAFSDWPHLFQLDLSGTSVTDDGLIALDRLPALEELFLCRTRVTDVGLRHLAGATNLRSLYVDGTTVTAAGLGGLSRTNPLVTVW